MNGEYRVRRNPTQPHLVDVAWRRDDRTAVWVHVDTVTDLHHASDAMVHHRDHKEETR